MAGGFHTRQFGPLAARLVGLQLQTLPYIIPWV
jgi:hypothetical protein